jgi:hypothetical protein
MARILVCPWRKKGGAKINNECSRREQVRLIDSSAPILPTNRESAICDEISRVTMAMPGGLNLLPGLVPIGQKIFQPNIRKWVLQNLLHHAKRQRGNLRTRFRRAQQVTG